MIIPDVQVLERTTHRAPLGLRVWDIATDSHLIDGLEIEVMRGTRSTRAFVNRSGIYCALGVPELIKQFELNADDKKAWETEPLCYQIKVRDPANRFLPFIFDADLPADGLFNWLAQWKSPPQSFKLLTDLIPLFSSVSRPVPNTFAVVRAELREFQTVETKQPAAWSLLTVSVNGIVQGIGLADKEGRVAVLFPYPKQLQRTLGSNDFSWNIELTAYYKPWKEIPEIPNLNDLLERLDSPRTLFRSTVSGEELPLQQLKYRVPLTARTEITATEKPSSFLFVNKA